MDGLVAGCVTVLEGPTCRYVPGSTITLWAQTTVDDAKFVVDGVARSSRGRPAGDGVRFELPIDDGASKVAVQSETGRFEVRLQPVETATPTESLARRSAALRDAGLRSLRAGRVEEARSKLLESLASARRAEDDHQQRETIYLLTYIDVRLLGRLADAKARLETIPAPLQADGHARAAIAFFRGELAAQLMDWSEAEDRFAEAATLGGWSFGRFGPGAKSDRALLHLAMGDAERALAIWDDLLKDEHLDDCTRALSSGNAGWALALRGAELDRAHELLEAALRGYTSTCPRAADADAVRVNLAWLAVDRGDSATAQRQLDERETKDSPTLDAWTWAARARALHADGDLDAARASYTTLRAIAERLRDGELAWLARVGLGRVALDAGAVEVAVEELTAAEAQLGSDAARVPLTRGHFGLLAQRNDSGYLLVTTLAKAGRPEEALRALDRIRARASEPLRFHAAIDALDPAARRDWTDALETYTTARARLDAYLAEGWARRDDETERRRREAELSSQMDAALDRAAALVTPRRFDSGALLPPPGVATLAPVGDLLLIATSSGASFVRGRSVTKWWREASPKDRPTAYVRIVSDDPTLAIELLDASALRIPVTLATRVAAPTITSTKRSGALVVADPQRNLVDARREGAEVDEALSSAGDVELLVGEEASRAAFRRALDRPRIFHFAGHGRWDGPHGWSSTLTFFDGELRATDVLLLPSPPLVVLSGCTTAADSQRRADPEMSMARAFIGGGAQIVFATHRPVDSGVARRFAAHLYGFDPLLESPRRAYLAALRHLAEDGAPWQPFVLLER